MQKFTDVAELHEYLAEHHELVIVTDGRELTDKDVRAYASIAGDFNPAHCVPGFEKHTLLKGRSSQGSAIITRAEGVFVALELFDIYPEIIALGIKELEYTAPLNVGDVYRYRFVFKNMRRSKRMYKFECQIDCEKLDVKTQCWKSITEWLWLPAYVDHAEHLGPKAVERLRPRSYSYNIMRYVLAPKVIAVILLSLFLLGLGHATLKANQTAEKIKAEACPDISETCYFPTGP